MSYDATLSALKHLERNQVINVHSMDKTIRLVPDLDNLSTLQERCLDYAIREEVLDISFQSVESNEKLQIIDAIDGKWMQQNTWNLL